MPRTLLGKELRERTPWGRGGAKLCIGDDADDLRIAEAGNPKVESLGLRVLGFGVQGFGA